MKEEFGRRGKLSKNLVLTGDRLQIHPIKKIRSRNCSTVGCTLREGTRLLYSWLEVDMAPMERQLLFGLRTIFPRQGDRSTGSWSVEESKQGKYIMYYQER